MVAFISSNRCGLAPFAGFQNIITSFICTADTFQCLIKYSELVVVCWEIQRALAQSDCIQKAKQRGQRIYPCGIPGSVVPDTVKFPAVKKPSVLLSFILISGGSVLYQRPPHFLSGVLDYDKQVTRSIQTQINILTPLIASSMEMERTRSPFVLICINDVYAVSCCATTILI